MKSPQKIFNIGTTFLETMKEIQSRFNLFTFVTIFLLISSVIPGTLCFEETEQASTPPRGWNSFDSFTWTISEQEFLENAQIMAKRLLPLGYEYAVVDFLWYRLKVEGVHMYSVGYDVIDEWGRLVPDPQRWPSSRDGKGFTEVGAKVHDMGLKFGIHIMRGLSNRAFNANTPILDVTTGKAYEESGRKWYAKDIGITERPCGWMPKAFMSVNTKLGAGRAFLKSLHQQYADWGVDFVKHDCIFGGDLDLDEISYVSKVLTEVKRPIVYSLSPGAGATPAMAELVNGLVNMYRITADDWDTWSDVATHFNISRDFAAAHMAGAKGLNGKSWPDLDMLPLGWISSPSKVKGPYRMTNLTLDEQRTQVTLWSIAKSPIMFGGDMRQLDDSTFSLISNPTLLEINSFSSNNMEFPHISSTKFGQGTVAATSDPNQSRAWIATGRNGEVYVAFFNLDLEKVSVSMMIGDLNKAFPERKFSSCKCREEWSGKYFGIVKDSLSIEVESHGTAVFVLSCFDGEKEL